MIINDGLVLLFLPPMVAILLAVICDWLFGLVAAAVKGRDDE